MVRRTDDDAHFKFDLSISSKNVLNLIFSSFNKRPF